LKHPWIAIQNGTHLTDVNFVMNKGINLNPGSAFGGPIALSQVIHMDWAGKRFQIRAMVKSRHGKSLRLSATGIKDGFKSRSWSKGMLGWEDFWYNFGPMTNVNSGEFKIQIAEAE
jgi:hypothetical protein